MIDQVKLDELTGRTKRAYARLFASDDAQIVMRDLFRFCNVASSSYAPGDAHETSFQEGKRRVALRILSMADIKPERALKLAQETLDD